MNSLSSVFCFDALVLGYRQSPVIHNLTGEIKAGTLLAIVGANGTGKSTLLKTLSSLMKPLSGKLLIGSNFKKNIAYLPQKIDLDLTFPISVRNFAAMGLWKRTGTFRPISSSIDKIIYAALADVGIEKEHKKPISAISAGQMQRLLFARLILQDASVLLLDEPFTGLDEQSIRNMLSLMHKWNKEGRTILSVVHDLDLVRKHMPETLLLGQKTISWGYTDEILRPDSPYIEHALCTHIRPVIPSPEREEILQ